MKINASIVLFHNDKEEITKAINCFLDSTQGTNLYLVDNSKTDDLKVLQTIDDRIEYIFNNANLGYGKAHNIAIKKSIEAGVPYHLVLNPDVHFEKGVLEQLLEYMEEYRDVGNIMPLVLYPDGDVQHLAKLLPTPVDLVLRRFVPFKGWKEKRNNRYELRFFGYDKIANIPNLSGCFMLLRTSALKEVGLFDENIFMYLEDVDLNRRIHSRYKTVFYPKVSIIHEYAKESYKNKKLLYHHIKSAIYYFNKWGWFFDKERDKVNAECLKELNYTNEVQ